MARATVDKLSSRLGLAYKIYFLVATLMVIVVVVTCAVFIVSQKKLIVKRARTESVSLARTMAAALANAVVLKDYAFIIEHCMLVVRSRPDLRYIVVIKRDRESLIHQADGWRAERLNDATSKRLEKIEDLVFLRHRSVLAGEEVLEAALPITITEAKWGVIRLGFSVEPLERAVSAMYRSAVMIGLICLGVALLGTILLTRVISRPIIQLTRAARRISAGDLKQSVAISSKDEIGELAAAFNKMTSDLDRTLTAEKDRAEELAAAYVELNQAHHDLKETQAKVIQSGRLASIGELAAGVAHEINNPLSVVLTYAVLLQEKLGELPAEVRSMGDFADRLDKIRIGAERCKAISTNLLAFSRQSEGEMRRVSLLEVVDRTLTLIGIRFQRAGIRIAKDVPEDQWVWGNVGQLQQVVTNLCLNALHAMETDGELRIRASAGENGTTALEISDTGPGIEEEHLDKIFDPFFTTKPLGQGTGLGLSIVYGIISKHRGEISVDSAPGRGATFRISLPAGDRGKP